MYLWVGMITDLQTKYDIALQMLAYWVVSVDKNGTQWDDWDDAYKDAAYRDTPIRADIDFNIAAIKAQWFGD